MSTLLGTLESVFVSVIQITWQASFLVVLIGISQYLFGSRLAPKWRQTLWLVVLLRLILPQLPHSSLSVYSVPHHMAAFITTMASGGEYTLELSPLPATANPYSLGWLPLASIVWATVALGLIIIFMLQNLWLTGTVAKRRVLTDSDELDRLEDCKKLMNVNTWIAPIITPRVQGPALLGTIRPRLLLPPGWRETTTAEQRRHIFLHELAHARRHDVLLRWVWTLLASVFWFNPLIWWVRQQIRKDQELASDSLVLEILNEDERPAYGQTLLDQFQQLNQLPLTYGAAGLVEQPANMKRRISMALDYKKASAWNAVVALATIVVLGFIGLTSAQAVEKKDAAASASEQAFPVTVLVFTAKEGVKLEDSKALLDAFNEGNPKGRTHHYRTANVDGRLVGFMCADTPGPIADMLKSSPKLTLLRTFTLNDEAAFKAYQEMPPDQRANQAKEFLTKK